jgi:hypothetical protein
MIQIGQINILLMFCTMFIGNATIFEIPILLFWASIYLLLILNFANYGSIKFKNTKLIPFFLIGVSCIYFQDNYRIYDEWYFLWPIELVLLTIGLIVHTQIKFNRKKSDLTVSILLLLVFIFGGFLNLDEDGRANFIFGSNVLYRIYIFLACYIFFHDQSKSWIKYLSIILGLFGVFITQSVGGYVVILVISIVFIYKYLRIYKFLFLSLIGAFLTLVIYFAESILLAFELYSRITSVKLDSTNERLNAIINIPFDLNFFGNNYYEYQRVYYSEGFQYPHNIILELSYYYGFLGIIFSIILINTFMDTYMRVLINYKKMNDLQLTFVFSFLIISIGAMFSGDIVDNIYCMAFLFSNFFTKYSHKRKIELQHV